jgi:hypothetical protein
MDVLGPIEVEAAKELVKLLVGGVAEVARKVPALWRRSGEAKQKLMSEELERSAAELSDASEPERARVRQEARWEAHLRSLLAEDPEAEADLRELLTRLRQAVPAANTSGVQIGGDVRAEHGGIAIGGVTGGSVSLGGHREDPPMPGRTQG